MKALWIRFVLMGPFAPILVQWAEAQMQTTMPQTTLQQAALAGLAIGLAGFVTMEALGAGALATVALSEAPAIVAAIGGMLAQGGLGALAGGITIGVLGSGIAISLLAAGLVVVVVAPAIVNAMQQNAARGYGGPSGEMTDDTAAALQKALYPPPIHINFNQLSATDPTLTAPSNIPRGTDPNPASIGGGQVANPPSLHLELTPIGQLNVDLTPVDPTSPDVDDGLNLDAIDAASLDAAVASEAGEYGWIDGICRQYATGTTCDDEATEYIHHIHHDVSSPSALWLLLLTGFGWPVGRKMIRWA